MGGIILKFQHSTFFPVYLPSGAPFFLGCMGGCQQGDLGAISLPLHDHEANPSAVLLSWVIALGQEAK